MTPPLPLAILLLRQTCAYWILDTIFNPIDKDYNVKLVHIDFFVIRLQQGKHDIVIYMRVANEI